MKINMMKLLAILLSMPIGALADDYIIKKGDHYSNTTDLPSYFQERA